MEVEIKVGNKVCKAKIEGNKVIPLDKDEECIKIVEEIEKRINV